MPNSLDVVRRAVASAIKDLTTNTVLLDFVSMFFTMRERVYAMTQSRAPNNRKVIVTFDVGRFQEWRQMMSDGFSYVAVDPDISVEGLSKRAKRTSILPYDCSSSFSSQVISISKRQSAVLWTRCKFARVMAQDIYISIHHVCFE